jgi:hypothetical protein
MGVFMKTLLLALATLASMNVFAAKMQSLSHDDSIGQMAEEVGAELSDANIAGGVTELSAGIFTDLVSFNSASEFESFVRTQFAEALQEEVGKDISDELAFDVSMMRFSEITIKLMTAAIMESNDYNTKNKELLSEQENILKKVISPLTKNETLVGHIKTKIKESEESESRVVQFFILINSDKKAVKLYTLQGSM